MPQVHEMLGDVLLDMHNIHHYQRFMSQVREEIQVLVHGSFPLDCIAPFRIYEAVGYY